MSRLFTACAWGFVAGAGMCAAMHMSPAFGLISAGVCGLFAALATFSAKAEPFQ